MVHVLQNCDLNKLKPVLYVYKSVCEELKGLCHDSIKLFLQCAELSSPYSKVGANALTLYATVKGLWVGSICFHHN